MDLIEGLSCGFFHFVQTGGSQERTSVFKQRFKSYVDQGLFIRDIQQAPRDSRYRIDYYYSTSPEFTIEYKEFNLMSGSSVYHHKEELSILGITSPFNWHEEIVIPKSEIDFGEYSIGYKDFPNSYGGKFSAFYFKFEGVLNTLIFNLGPDLVDYNKEFWREHKGKIQHYNSVDKLLYEIGHHSKRVKKVGKEKVLLENKPNNDDDYSRNRA